jgi:hypothetical protein
VEFLLCSFLKLWVLNAQRGAELVAGVPLTLHPHLAAGPALSTSGGRSAVLPQAWPIALRPPRGPQPRVCAPQVHEGASTGF